MMVTQAEPGHLSMVNHSLAVLRVHEVQRFAESQVFLNMLKFGQPKGPVMKPKHQPSRVRGLGDMESPEGIDNAIARDRESLLMMRPPPPRPMPPTAPDTGRDLPKHRRDTLSR